MTSTPEHKQQKPACLKSLGVSILHCFHRPSGRVDDHTKEITTPSGSDDDDQTTLPAQRNPNDKRPVADGVHTAQINRSAPSSNRLRTFHSSFRYLINLTPQQVEAFMASYVIYNLDWNDEDGMIQTLGINYEKKVGECLRAYYGVLNHLCALGQVEKMYIPPLMEPKVSVLDNQLLYEQSIARQIGLRPGDKVLDLGCGRGRVAAHMAQLSQVQVTGLNIDPDQIGQAWAFNTKHAPGNSFLVHDQNNLPLPFADQSFDAFYQIQALSLCKDLPSLFAELHRILKPGAKLSLLDWVRLPAYDAANPEHASLMRRVKPLIGAVGTPTPASLTKALENAGFHILRSDNASIDGFQAPLIDSVDVYFRALRRAIRVLVRMRVLPAHLRVLIDRLCLDGQAFVEFDRRRLGTTSYRIIAQKPIV
ncbi:hypothetical protein Q7P37_004461 [Cladosporium fusiforme]